MVLEVINVTPRITATRLIMRSVNRQELTESLRFDKSAAKPLAQPLKCAQNLVLFGPEPTVLYQQENCTKRGYVMIIPPTDHNTCT